MVISILEKMNGIQVQYFTLMTSNSIKHYSKVSFLELTIESYSILKTRIRNRCFDLSIFLVSWRRFLCKTWLPLLHLSRCIYFNLYLFLNLFMNQAINSCKNNYHLCEFSEIYAGAY